MVLGDKPESKILETVNSYVNIGLTRVNSDLAF